MTETCWKDVVMTRDNRNKEPTSWRRVGESGREREAEARRRRDDRAWAFGGLRFFRGLPVAGALQELLPLNEPTKVILEGTQKIAAGPVDA